MNRGFRPALIAGTLATLLAPRPMHADLITFTFAGEIVWLDGDVGFLGGTIPVGTPFSGSYTFESATPDIRPAEPRLGNYPGALTSFAMDVGPYHLSGVNGLANAIRVANDLNGADSYIAGDESTPLLGRPIQISVLFGDYQGEGFASDSLPRLPFSLNPFEDRIMQMSSTSSEFFIVGEVTVLAPEPCTLLLMGLAV